MQVAPVLTRRTIELLGEYVEKRVYIQLLDRYASSIKFFEAFANDDLQTMKDSFPLYSHRYFPYRVEMIKVVVLLLGKTRFEERYLALLDQIEDEIVHRAAAKSVSPEELRSIYTRYQNLFRRMWDLFPLQTASSLAQTNLQADIEKLLTVSTQFDFGFTVLNLALLDEVRCESKEKLSFLLEISSQKIDEFVASCAQLEQGLLSPATERVASARRRLASLAGAIEKTEAQSVLAAVEADCERVDAEW